MPTIEASVVIAQSPETIAGAFLDPTNAVFWTTDLERFEVISEEPGQVGSIAHLHYLQNDQKYVMEDVLEEIVPNQYFRSKVTGNGITARVETWLRKLNGQTQVTIRWSGRGNSLGLNVVLFLMRKKIRKQTRMELQTLKNLVETHGAHFSE